LWMMMYFHYCILYCFLRYVINDAAFAWANFSNIIFVLKLPSELPKTV
jgi:hypothetical protein